MEEIFGIFISILAARRRDCREERTVLKSLRDDSDPFSITEVLFKKNFRFPKDLCKSLMEELLEYDNQSSSIPFVHRFLCALNFYACGSYQQNVGNTYKAPMSQPSVSRALYNISNLIVTRKGQVVKFPENAEDYMEFKLG